MMLEIIVIKQYTVAYMLIVAYFLGSVTSHLKDDIVILKKIRSKNCTTSLLMGYYLFIYLNIANNMHCLETINNFYRAKYCSTSWSRKMLPIF